jgi:mannose-6-phosphate isomerase-like protein (cupin superfamily)
MRKHAAGFVAGLVAGAAITAVLFVPTGVNELEASSQTAAASKNASNVVLENARVRVRDVTFLPGKSAGMHTHDLPHVGVVIQGGTLVFKSPDGKSETMKLDAGGVGFRDANVTHDPTNPGKTAVRVIEVELK